MGISLLQLTGAKVIFAESMNTLSQNPQQNCEEFENRDKSIKRNYETSPATIIGLQLNLINVIELDLIHISDNAATVFFISFRYQF